MYVLVFVHVMLFGTVKLPMYSNFIWYYTSIMYVLVFVHVMLFGTVKLPMYSNFRRW